MWQRGQSKQRIFSSIRIDGNHNCSEAEAVIRALRETTLGGSIWCSCSFVHTMLNICKKLQCFFLMFFFILGWSVSTYNSPPIPPYKKSWNCKRRLAEYHEEPFSHALMAWKFRSHTAWGIQNGWNMRSPSKWENWVQYLCLVVPEQWNWFENVFTCAALELECTRTNHCLKFHVWWQVTLFIKFSETAMDACTTCWKFSNASDQRWVLPQTLMTAR